MRAGDSNSEAQLHRGVFATTHWSVVLAAGEQNTPESAEALEQLCRTYWYPIYVYVRHRGYSPEDTQDLTQQFFQRFLEKGAFSAANPARGRFRTFLLTSLQHFLADDWKHAHRAKRGGWAIEVPVEAAEAEVQGVTELTDAMTPERLYEEHWAITLLDGVLERVHEDYRRAGKERLFERLRNFVWGPASCESYAGPAKDLGLAEGTLRVAVHHLRKQYREQLRAEVAHTVSEPGEVDEELRYLITVVGKAS